MTDFDHRFFLYMLDSILNTHLLVVQSMVELKSYKIWKRQTIRILNNKNVINNIKYTSSQQPSYSQANTELQINYLQRSAVVTGKKKFKLSTAHFPCCQN